jgi:hypothetical protein
MGVLVFLVMCMYAARRKYDDIAIPLEGAPLLAELSEEEASGLTHEPPAYEIDTSTSTNTKDGALTLKR